ncbi:MAG: cysteine synthase A [Myxococcota bacterium]|nr:cysteine synthase A [Deltaproteobacteria bacterium]MDQ3335808.1 cysteine synthase A [Myxococcota bacterium]
MGRKFESILGTVGHTPVVRINKLAPPHVKLYVKIESFNPMGSVKDRLALGVIEDAERSGRLQPGQTVVEATSGNTGIGLAMVCAQKGYPLVVVMAENFSVERRKMMRFLGAKVVLTPAALKGSGMLAKAVELAEAHGWFLCRQFENEANADMHSRTTAPEILEAFAGEQLDYWVTGYGTGGTLKGVGRVLRERSPKTKIVVCEPDNSPVLGSGMPMPATGSHPLFRPHAMQGWSPDFIPKLTGDAVSQKLVDRIVPVDGEAAMRCARDLAQKEGIFVGITSGATLAGALEIARAAPEGANILCMLPDTGERYLSTPLFADVPADMTAAEVEVSRSTPSARFDVAAPAAPAQAPPPLDAEANAALEQIVREQPVVMFAFAWCEFCWAVRKLFAAYKIEHRVIPLDSVEYQADNRGGKLRAALGVKAGATTIPQIFVGGELVGGCTETMQAIKDGRFQQMLARANATYDAAARDEPFSFLPTWLQKR